MKTGLPIEAVLPELRAALARAPACVLEAPPGAGKTTLVPLALKDEPWLGPKKIVMLEPRRLAARAAAARMAELLGEPVGETVGYRIRLEAKVSARTRIEVLTEGLLTRRLERDPALEDVGLLIFDEFHERSLHADLGLALALEAQSALNEKLKILVMSATLDGEAIAKLLGGAPLIRSEGKLFPIETHYLPQEPRARLDEGVAAAVRRALRESEGGILVFLPGEGEIRAVERALAETKLPDGVKILPLYGALPQSAQDEAIRPAKSGARKIVLATAIAETSLTIEDVRAIVDSGLARTAQYDPASGLTKLVTQRVSLASADQRRGRAGQLAPGACYRLWAEPQTRALARFTPPEILNADLASFALDLALWGVRDPAQLKLLDQPPQAAYAQAVTLLKELDALSNDGRIAPHGRALAEFGAHPRLAHMMIEGAELGHGATAAALAAVVSERDIVKGKERDADLRTRLEIFAGDKSPAADIDRPALMRAREQARLWQRALKTKSDKIEPARAGVLTALAYPDRIAQRRVLGSFRLAGGRGAMLPETSPLAREDFLAIAHLDAGAANARIFTAAPISLRDIETLFAAHIEKRASIAWDARERAVLSRERETYEALVLAERPLVNPDPGAIAAAMLEGVKSLGLDALPWTPPLRQLQARASFLRRRGENEIPDISDDALTASLGEWLAPFLAGMTRANDLARLDLAAALDYRLGRDALKRLNALAPAHVTVPSGMARAIDYSGAEPSLAVRLQELFGLRETPRVLNGKAPLTLHLLSPANRPVQVTKDLTSFWANAYPEVKRDLKARYPRHYWPDDPLIAEPTHRARPRRP